MWNICTQERCFPSEIGVKFGWFASEKGTVVEPRGGRHARNKCGVTRGGSGGMQMEVSCAWESAAM